MEDEQGRWGEMGKSEKSKRARDSVEGGTRDSNRRARSRQPSFWARPVVWLGGILVAALGVALTNLFVDRFGEVLEVVPEAGDPVSVDFVEYSDMWGRSMALPSDVTVNADDVAALNAMSVEEQQEWFIEREGARPHALFVRIALSGNRNRTVRIVDIVPDSDCTAPADAGTLFVDPPAGGDDSIVLNFDLDSPRPVAMVPEVVDGETVDRPYFANRTVSLAEDEQQVFLIGLKTELATCAVFLDLSVLDGRDVVTQRVSRQGEPFRVTADLPRTDWKQVYLGGVESCQPGVFIEATEAWRRNELSPCE